MRKLIFCLRMLGAAVLFYGAVHFWTAGSAGTGTYIFLKEPIGLSEAQALRLREGEQEEALCFCFWGQPGERVLFCPETGRTAPANVTAVFGDPELLAPGGGVLNWREEGCLLAPETAEALFGTSSVGEQSLECAGRAYTAVGTLPSTRPAIVRSAASGDKLTALVVAAGPSEAEAFLLRHGLSGEVLDLSLLECLAGNMVLLMPLLLALDLEKLILSDWREAARRGKLLRAGIAAALALGCLCLCVRCFSLPAGMLPPSWSDFSFWGTWWEGQKGNLLRLLSSPLGENQLQMTVDMVKSMVMSLAGAALLPGRSERERAWSHAAAADRG